MPDEADLRFAPEKGCVAAWDCGLTPEESARLSRLEAHVPWISLHDHPIRLPDPMTKEVWARYTSLGRERISFRGLRLSGLSAVFYSMLGTDDPVSVLRWAAFARRSASAEPDSFIAESFSDAAKAKREGRLALFLSLESATPVGQDLSNVDLLFGAGIRSMGLTYNTRNTLGDGLLSPTDEGLTPFGRLAVARMQELGMLVDLGHVGDRTSLDALEHATRPVVISHAGARALWPSPRMKPDEVIRACAGTGGVIGIEAAPHTTLTLTHRTHDIEAVMAHVEYSLELVGEDHVALGPDTFFGDHRGLHELHPTSLPSPEHPIVPYVAGFENPGECHRNACTWMIHHGYDDRVIAKVLGENVLRVVREALPLGTAEVPS